MKWRRIVECALVAGLVLVLYWPWALPRLGPFIEDAYFLNVLWRMECGALPYRDFEFLYGPLMIAPLGAWIDLVGYSMPAYYAYYAVMQMLLAIVVMAILQSHIQRAWLRYLAFVALAPFLFDLLYGLNWSSWRYFTVVLVILSLSQGAIGWRVCVAAVMTGLQAAYSYEFGIATLLTGVTIIALDLFSDKRRQAILGLFGFAAVSITIWYATVLAATGTRFSDYLDVTRLVAETATQHGLGRFAFYWTVQSAALFLVFSFGLVLAGLALSRLGRLEPDRGDRQLAGALAFALIALKIALQRADFLHLAVPFVPLLVVFLINAPRTLARMNNAQHGAVIGLICVASLAHCVAYAPWSSWLLRSTKNGWQHELTGRATVGEIEARLPTINVHRSYLNDDVRQLARSLAASDVAERPVLFYRSTWDLPPRVGVCPEGFAFYDLLYSDDLAPLAELPKENPDLLIVIKTDEWEALGQPTQSVAPELAKLDGIRQIAQFVGSSHYAQSALENGGIEGLMWREALGETLTDEFRPLEHIGKYLILTRHDP